MRKVAVVALLFLVLPAYARDARTKARPAAAKPATFKRLAPDATRLSRLLGQARRGDVTPSAIIDNRSSRIVVIPAAGSAAGANGTFFRSDVTLVNMNDADQSIVAVWFPNGNPDGLVEFEGLIESGPPFTYVDFVGDALGLTGIGSLVFVPITADGTNLDANAAIDAYSRIWSPAPNGAAGTFSQPFPSVDLFHLDGEYEALMLGLRQDTGFRTNYGIANFSDVSLPMAVTVFNNDGAIVSEFEVTVRSDEMILRSLPAGNFGNISILVSVTDDILGDDFQWTAFASSTDNFNGDGWVSIGSKPYDDDGLDTGQ
ncbi:MAG TPA: hypothetical protein VEK11_01745 [Thermoanaerobaculia bacterium]|nr:hypothetical protein [Thermoanaerobaculia bacterium]